MQAGCTDPQQLDKAFGGEHALVRLVFREIPERVNATTIMSLVTSALSFIWQGLVHCFAIMGREGAHVVPGN